MENGLCRSDPSQSSRGSAVGQQVSESEESDLTPPSPHPWEGGKPPTGGWGSARQPYSHISS